MERNDTHRQRSETFNNNSQGGDQPSHMNKHRKTNKNRVMQPNAGHPKAYKRRRGLKKRRIKRIQKKRSLKRNEARKKNQVSIVFPRTANGMEFNRVRQHILPRESLHAIQRKNGDHPGIIRGFNQILTEFAIFRTRKVHLPVRWHRAVHKGTKHNRSTWHDRWDKHPHGYFLHSMAAAKCPSHGM